MFEDRVDAGRKLAEKLLKFKDKDAIVLAIPRGGVEVGAEIAKKLNLELDVIVVRKLGYPPEPEYGIGAISENNSVYLDEKAIKSLDLSKSQIDRIRNEEEKELKRRVFLYRKGKSLQSLKRKTVILVDDGLATGVSAQASIIAVRKKSPGIIVFATPVSGGDSANIIRKKVDLFISVLEANELFAIGAFYRNFEQVSDEKVIELLSSRKAID